MKKYLLAICIIASLGTGFAQDKASPFTDQNSDQARDPRVDQMNFVPNEVLVKFKDEVPLSSAARLRSAGLSAVDKVLQANGVDSLVRLFPNTKSSLLRSTGVARIVKDPQGRDMKIPNLDKIYKITLPQLRSTSSVPVNIFQVIEDLKALPEVEYAEPNYIYSVDDLQPVGPVLTADDVKKMQSGLRSSQSAVVPNDPLYAQQWYIPAVKADLVWEQTTGDTTQVIAILDTGVDWNHPDLKNKIWTNKDEIPGNGIDDDGNGLIDDVRGWDYINNDNNPTDDNSHGTHVAGIAAAETNNGIGVAGVCPNAKIMPLKVFTSKGQSDVSTLVNGIYYAANNGATVLNMSFGGYARSLTMENALANAYASAILVAAAGNDSHSIYDRLSNGLEAIFYPAALSFVFGVQSDGGYSNFDPDGPVYSEIEGGLNYELKAPGNAFSTVPNGNYRIYQGTSMATPVISGAIALYRSLYPEKALEELWSDFVHSNDGIIDLNNAFFGSEKKPILDLKDYTLGDTNEGCDKDGQADAGEIVDLIAQIRNTGSPASAVYAKIMHVDGDSTDITILNDSVNFGSIGIYRSMFNNSNPFRIQINRKCFNNRTITLEVSIGTDQGESISKQKINFIIYNGSELSGILLKDTILTPDKNWVIANSLRISTGVTLKILPGTTVDILSGVDNRGKVSCIGTADSLIYLNGSFGGSCIYSFVNIDAKNGSITGNNFKNCILRNGQIALMADTIDNCYLDGFTTYSQFNVRLIKNSVIKNSINSQFQCEFDRCLLNNIRTTSWTSYAGISGAKYTIFDKIGDVYTYLYPNYQPLWKDEIMMSDLDHLIMNSFLENGRYLYFLQTSGSSDSQSLPNQYWGTSNKLKIKKKYIDFNNSASLPYLLIDPLLTSPSDSCHAHVWKVLVNGKDAQDEVVDPVGVGKQRFDVYFNRAMNTSINPKVSFGGIYPYTSNSINEDGFWSEDGKIYSVYKTIRLTNGDGVNRICVAGAKEANGWNFEIPVEDSRFSFIISAANSASAGFMATAGLGKVILEWNNSDIEDGLGYNLYRMEQINDSTLRNPIIINSSLITDTIFSDFSVTPNKKYYYYYRILRTNFTETDSSKVVSAVPFTASKGDANGDLSVNVLDITTIVAFLLNNNPQPFITEAADMNSDGNINVLDIVGVVNQVLYGGLRSANIAEDQQVSLYLQNDTLFADATTAIGGLQFDVSGVTSINDIQVLNALQAFESGYSQRDSTTLRLLYYSMSGKSIAAGSRIPLLKLKKGCILKDVLVSDKAGAAIPVSLSDPTIGNRNDQGMLVAELGQNYPNPSKGQTTLPAQIFEKVDEAAISIYNMLGQQVKFIKLDNPTVGKHEIPWNSSENKGMFIYKLEIRIGGQQYVSPLKKMIVL